MPRKRKQVERVARIIWFVDGEPALDRVGHGPNREAAELVVAKLLADKVIGAGDEALSTAFVMLAESVDATPTDARLWGQYRDASAVMRALAKEKAPADDDDWTSALGSTQVRNTPKPRARKPRASGGRGVAKAGQGPNAVPAARVGRGARGGA